MDAFLSVRQLQAGYGRAQVLFDMSLDVRAGEVVTLLGRNGMGRSTTVKCLFGMLAARAGEIWRKTLEEYEQPPLDDGIRASLGEYVVRRRAELGD